MGTWQLLLVGLVMLLGLLGVVTPGVPGPLIVWAGTLWWTMAELSAVAWAVLVGGTGLLLLDQAFVRLRPPPPSPRRTTATVAEEAWATTLFACLAVVGAWVAAVVLG
ncbi:hypothetical protein [Streptomyces hesseae]|uniref:DUF456 domain-containing protein n=1 Tax=Streptomyces hesseae TaxID=3075519 RepID=A0ABU2SM42_9ACTN|nr:hypothetical protein [Streptomyces sp. DSM 40473]MDT0450053.1 hypothetical protein [Streptomyces sp. DSM 40473]